MAAGWIRSSWRSCFDILPDSLCTLFIIMDYAGVRHGTSGRVAVGIGVTVFAVVFLGTNFSALAKVRG